MLTMDANHIEPRRFLDAVQHLFISADFSVIVKDRMNKSQSSDLVFSIRVSFFLLACTRRIVSSQSFGLLRLDGLILQFHLSGSLGNDDIRVSVSHDVVKVVELF